MASDRETFTLMPLHWYWLGRLILYVTLVLVPAIMVGQLAKWVPEEMHQSISFVANILLLPLLYAGLYLWLRKINARSQSFIYLVILFYAGLGIMEARRALTVGGFLHWTGAFFCALYVLAFVWLVYHSTREDKRRLTENYLQDREEQINIQAEAILRARELEKQRNGSDDGAS